MIFNAIKRESKLMQKNC